LICRNIWTEDVAADRVFRLVNRVGIVTGERLGGKVVWQMLKKYAAEVGVAGIAPHDLRRTCAKLCRAAGGELEQIQIIIGPRLGSDHRTVSGHPAGAAHAPNDAIKLKLV